MSAWFIGLVPVGQAQRNHLVLMMSDEGAVYGAFEDFVVQVGCDGMDAINALCEGRQLAPVRVHVEKAAIAECDATLSPTAVAVLSEAGWSEGRAIDTSAMGQILRDCGYTPSLAVDAFLSAYGCLRLLVPPAGSHGSPDECYFSPSECATFPRPVAREYERRLGKAVCPVGVAANRLMSLFMTEDGEVVGGMAAHSEILLQVGGSAITALNVLCDADPGFLDD